jgi:hypothetical protein
MAIQSEGEQIPKGGSQSVTPDPTGGSIEPQPRFISDPEFLPFVPLPIPSTPVFSGSTAGSGGSTGPRASLLRRLVADVGEIQPIAGRPIFNPLAGSLLLPGSGVSIGSPASVLSGLGLSKRFRGRLVSFAKRVARWGYSPATWAITSALRSAEHNAAVGGVENSAHLVGEAVDFVADADRFDLGEAAYRARLQIIPYATHFHLEISPDGRRGLA